MRNLPILLQGKDFFASLKLILKANETPCTFRFPNNPPQSKEEYYYRAVFDKYYPNCDKFVHVWEGGCRADGAPWKNKSYTRGGLVDIEVLKKGHGCADMITV